MRVLILLLPPDEPDAVPIPVGCFAAIYYRLREAGVEVVLGTALGGPVMLDVRPSLTEEAAGRRFHKDRAARDDLADTLEGEQLAAEDFAAAVILGSIEDSNHLNDGSPLAATLHRLFQLHCPLVLIPPAPPAVRPAGLLLTSFSYDDGSAAVAALLGALGIFGAH